MSDRRLSFECSRRKVKGFLLSELKIYGAPRSCSGKSLIQLSDFHYGPATSASHISAAIELANSFNPDLVLLTGDYIQVSHIGLRHLIASRLGPNKVTDWKKFRRSVRRSADELAEQLQELVSKEGIYASYGNHDHDEGLNSIRRSLAPQLIWLNNETITLPWGLTLSGVDDYKRGKPSLKKINRQLEDSSEQNFKLLLCHNPDIVLHKDAELLSQFDLVICGHTHGGQIRLPYLPIPITRTKQRDFVQGLAFYPKSSRQDINKNKQEIKKTAIYVNQGIGYGSIPLRLFCPPELTILSFQ